ncbi:hypothetical protein [Rosenbergiella australiborealis]|uniref:hypothetical protein n=1 Tax=Rosenbergiella australiborealis TaxID=1544696 RepID=UPI001F4D37DB|nr:hypothetical protein [Rosenbergiella australiborealis]
MIKTVLAGCEKLRRYRDFYFGIKPDSIQFYQLGDGYLETFSLLYRYTANTHYLHSDKTHDSFLTVSAQRLRQNAEQGQKALQNIDFTQVLMAVGQQLYLATSTISADKEGLFLAATLYNKAESFDPYRQFVEMHQELPLMLTAFFNEAVTASELLKKSAYEASVNGFLNNNFEGYQCYRRLMNRLYVMINMGFYLLRTASVDMKPFLQALYQSHLSQKWVIAKQDKLQYFHRQKWDINHFRFIEEKGGELCYRPETGELVMPPNYSQPDIGGALCAITRQYEADKLSYSSRDWVNTPSELKTRVAKTVMVME